MTGATGDNTTYGWYAGGNSPGGPISSIQRITYATDTATASIRGPLNLPARGPSGSTDFSTYGWFGGGYSPSGGTWLSTVQRITYATDTATASYRGSLASAVYKMSGTSGIA
jgi:hypothetical protein